MSEAFHFFFEDLCIDFIQFSSKVFSLLDLLLESRGQFAILCFELGVLPLKFSDLLLEKGKRFLKFEVFFIEKPLIFLNPFEQRTANAFFCDHDGFFTCRD